MAANDELAADAFLGILTDEERAGLRDVDDAEALEAPEVIAALKAADIADAAAAEAAEEEEVDAAAASGADPDLGAEAALDAAAAAAEDTEAALAAAAEAATAAKAEDTEDTPSESNATPILPAAVEAKLEELETAKNDLKTSFQDGEIDEEQFFAQQDKLIEDLATVKADLITVTTNYDTWIGRWNDAKSDYQKENPDLWKDGVLEHFDREVRAITSSTDPTDQAMPMRAKLEEAHRVLASRSKAAALGVQAPKAATPAKKVDPDPAPVPAAAKKDPDPVVEEGVAPRTIKSIPASEGTQPGGDGKYADLDRILASNNADQIEAAIAKLPESEQEHYASHTF